jgi:hypothetical protein
MRASLPTSLSGLGVCSTARAAVTRSFPGFLVFSRELSVAALSAVGFAVPSVGGVR